MNKPRPLKLQHVLGAQRPDETLIARRNNAPLYLSDFRTLVLTLIDQINLIPSARWALCFNDSYTFAAALLALCYCGKTSVIPGHLRQAVLEEQANEFDALLTDLPLNLNCATINTTLLSPETYNNSGALPIWPRQRDVVLFTSGSTGKPKAIRKSIELLELENQLLVERFSQKLQGSILVSTVSHQHLYGLTFRIFLPLLAGLPFEAESIEYHEQLQKYPENSVTLIACPAFLKRLDTKLAPIPCNMVFSAGGPLDYTEAQQVKKCLGVLPQEIYGTSETGIIATRTQSKPNQIWSTFSGITVSQNADKTITINSPLFKSDNGGKINDIIVPEKEGFHLSGRQDRIIKIEEKRISLTEIEQRLMQLPEIADASVVVLPQRNRAIIGAVIVLSDAGYSQRNGASESAMTRRLRQTLRNWLEPVALPKRWRIVDTMPQNNQGKRTYLELQELFYDVASGK